MYTVSYERHQIPLSIKILSIFDCESEILSLLLTKEQRLGEFKDRKAEKNLDGKDNQEAENKINKEGKRTEWIRPVADTRS